MDLGTYLKDNGFSAKMITEINKLAGPVTGQDRPAGPTGARDHFHDQAVLDKILGKKMIVHKNKLLEILASQTVGTAEATGTTETVDTTETAETTETVGTTETARAPERVPNPLEKAIVEKDKIILEKDRIIVEKDKVIECQLETIQKLIMQTLNIIGVQGTQGPVQATSFGTQATVESAPASAPVTKAGINIEKYTEETYKVHGPATYEHRTIIKQIERATWVSESKVWVFPVDKIDSAKDLFNTNGIAFSMIE